ncbi:hypothetical protein LXT21_24170 [Myxococcus sp. K38C18041901]|uniref:hypothetical protein n=1 Tax=Myxococcus guangdongensis TaxID=2906760 RepID=UPI0020A7229D|nr:hypothetical protein [Myxococcus guangdongensis]MCP3061885.1 hypothetical protein [Myxococcus guangdongensis]
MKPIYLAALMAFGSVSCVDNTPKLQVLHAALPDPDCTIPEDEAILRGSLNLGLAGDFLLGLIITSNLTDTPILVGEGGQVSDPDSQAIYIRSVDVSYRTEPDLGIEDANVPLFGGFRPNQDSSLLLGLLTRDAQAALLAATTGGGIVDTLVTMRFRGETATGSKVEVNEFTFPLVVTNVGFVCPKPGEVPSPRSEACDLRGLNGVVPECEAP